MHCRSGRTGVAAIVNDESWVAHAATALFISSFNLAARTDVSEAVSSPSRLAAALIGCGFGFGSDAAGVEAGVGFS